MHGKERRENFWLWLSLAPVASKEEESLPGRVEKEIFSDNSQEFPFSFEVRVYCVVVSLLLLLHRTCQKDVCGSMRWVIFFSPDKKKKCCRLQSMKGKKIQFITCNEQKSLNVLPVDAVGAN